MKRITVTITAEQLAYLVKLREERKAKDGYAPSVSQLIRGLINQRMEEDGNG